jgi:hypothetical protein
LTFRNLKMICVISPSAAENSALRVQW